jgi:hypothetical protein
MNASFVPSGENCGHRSAPLERSEVMFRIEVKLRSPVVVSVAAATKRSTMPPEHFSTHATHLPSGDASGVRLPHELLVSRTTCVPSARMAQSSSSPLSKSGPPVGSRVKTIHPSSMSAAPAGVADIGARVIRLPAAINTAITQLPKRPCRLTSPVLTQFLHWSVAPLPACIPPSVSTSAESNVRLPAAITAVNLPPRQSEIVVGRRRRGIPQEVYM